MTECVWSEDQICCSYKPVMEIQNIFIDCHLTCEGQSCDQCGDCRFCVTPPSEYTTTTSKPREPPTEQIRGCFPSTATVNLHNGKTVKMSELQRGDQVPTGNTQILCLNIQGRIQNFSWEGAPT